MVKIACLILYCWLSNSLYQGHQQADSGPDADPAQYLSGLNLEKETWKHLEKETLGEKKLQLIKV